jgi:hypothetical protein
LTAPNTFDLAKVVPCALDHKVRVYIATQEDGGFATDKAGHPGGVRMSAEIPALFFFLRSRPNMRILIVEDEPKTAAYAKGLTEHGFVVDIAVNGVDGRHPACPRMTRSF